MPSWVESVAGAGIIAGMSLRRSDHHHGSDSGPAIAVVCLCDRGSEGLPQTLASVLMHTDPAVPVIVAGGDQSARVAARMAPSDRDVRLRSSTDAQALADELARADIAIVRPPCWVAAGWLDGLRASAGTDASLGLVVALGETDGSKASDDPGTDNGFATRAAARVAGGAHPGPRVPAHDPACCLIRRSAIDLIGAGDLAAGFIRRAERAGLSALAAESVVVAGGAPIPVADGEPALARAIGAAHRADRGVAVIIDARCLTGRHDGTRTHVLGLLRALGQTAGVRLTALVPEHTDAETRAQLDAGVGFERVSVPTAGPIPAEVYGDLVHRPFQIESHADLTALGRIADRLVITHQDLISFHQREYFATREAWLGYREMTRSALRAADHVVFFSRHVRADALAEDLVEAGRASVVPLGVDDEPGRSDDGGAARGGGGAGGATAETMLCLGTDFTHKNRLFALRVAQALQREHDWGGRLVLAGPAMRWGSSRKAEAECMAADARLRGAVHDLGEVSGADRRRLLGAAALVLYPTVHEGFGLIPFEAATHGRPCLWAPGSALAELLPVHAAEIVPWNAGATAEAALRLMRDPTHGRANVAAVLDAASVLSWERTARTLAGLYERVCAAPPAPAAALEREQGFGGAGLSDDAMRLVGPGGALARDLERPVLALATHEWVARPLFAALRAGYRLGHALARRRRADTVPPTARK